MDIVEQINFYDTIIKELDQIILHISTCEIYRTDKWRAISAGSASQYIKKELWQKLNEFFNVKYPQLPAALEQEQQTIAGQIYNYLWPKKKFEGYDKEIEIKGRDFYRTWVTELWRNIVAGHMVDLPFNYDKQFYELKEHFEITHQTPKEFLDYLINTCGKQPGIADIRKKFSEIQQKSLELKNSLKWQLRCLKCKSWLKEWSQIIANWGAIATAIATVILVMQSATNIQEQNLLIKNMRGAVESTSKLAVATAEYSAYILNPAAKLEIVSPPNKKLTLSAQRMADKEFVVKHMEKEGQVPWEAQEICFSNYGNRDSDRVEIKIVNPFLYPHQHTIADIEAGEKGVCKTFYLRQASCGTDGLDCNINALRAGDFNLDFNVYCYNCEPKEFPMQLKACILKKAGDC